MANTNYSRTFFSEKRAKAFADQIKKNGNKDVYISSGKDGFGQTQHRVHWN